MLTIAVHRFPLAHLHEAVPGNYGLGIAAGFSMVGLEGNFARNVNKTTPLQLGIVLSPVRQHGR
jgi:hypothetical protein